LKILVIQLRRIGDILVTTPVVGALREAFPDAVIDFLVEPMGEPVLRGLPGLNETIVFRKGNFFRLLADIRRRRYDWVVDFLNTPRSAQVTLASGAPVRAGFQTPFWGFVYNRRVPRSTEIKYVVEQKFDLLRALGLSPRPALPILALSAADAEGVESWWTEGPARFPVRIGLAPAHRHPVRQWPEEKWAALIPALLSRSDRAIVLFGGPGEEPLLDRLAAPHAGRVFVAPVGPWRRAPALMSRCGVLVSNCSGSMHAAVAAGVPTVTIYGPSVAENWNPRRPPHRLVRAEGLSCLGCCRNTCPWGHECMLWISPERVAREVEAVLS
jgi:ADP-heptose:LPS heptosyltransferase